MTSPGLYLRRPSVIEALHVATERDLWRAHAWARRHGLRASPVRPGVIKIYDHDNRMDLDVGSWLARDLNLNAWDVIEAGDFAAMHDEWPGEVA